jgi:hypothetical protein
MSGATAVNQILDKAFSGVNEGIRANLLQRFKMQENPVSVVQAKVLTNPISVKIQIVHPVGTNSANGNTPALLMQMMWLSSFFSTLLNFYGRPQNSKNKTEQGLNYKPASYRSRFHSCERCSYLDNRPQYSRLGCS